MIEKPVKTHVEISFNLKVGKKAIPMTLKEARKVIKDLREAVDIVDLKGSETNQPF